MRSSLLLATVVLMCCISVAHGLRRGLVTSVQSRSSVDYSETTKGTVGTRAGQTAFRVKEELLQSLPQRQNTRSQEMLKDTQEQSRASMSPEAMLVEVSEERPHILAGAPVILASSSQARSSASTLLSIHSMFKLARLGLARLFPFLLVAPFAEQEQQTTTILPHIGIEVLLV